MKKLLIALTLLLGMGAAAYADTLENTYKKIAAVEGAKCYSEKDTDKILAEMDTNLPFESGYSSVVWQEAQGSAGVTAGYDELMGILQNADANDIIGAQNNYNTFMVLVAPTSQDDLLDVMAVWQDNYYGHVLAVYGTMTKENVNRLSFGEVVMNHFGVSIRPMSKRYYDKLQELAALQQTIWTDQAKHITGPEFNRLQKQFTRDAKKIDSKVK